MEPLSARYHAGMRRGWIMFWSVWIAIGLIMLVAGSGFDLLPLTIVGLALLAACGPLLVVTIRRLGDPRPVIVVDAHGYHDRRLGDAVPWGAITALRTRRNGNRIFLHVAVDDPARYLGNAGILKGPMLRINPATGYPPLASNLSGLDVAQDLLLAAVESRWAAQRG
jgi:hypothetical protein